MLGEDHSLTNDFPEYKFHFEDLCAHDSEFQMTNKRYAALDKEIRKLEMRDSPIEDGEMSLLKMNRAVLKDALYQKLASAAA